LNSLNRNNFEILLI